MPGVLIRDARLADLDGLSALEARTFSTDRMSRRSLRRAIGRPTARLRVATEKEGSRRILGYHLVLVRKGSRVARLYSIAVDGSARGGGLGQRLLADAEAVAAKAGRNRLRLEVRVGNRRAIALYESRGYRPIGRYDYYYGDGAHAFRYEKRVVSSTRRKGR